MVEKHIKSLLYDHDCVIIPDFGGLITRYVPARIHPVKHTFSPPSKKIAFNEKLTLNDGLLISTIAYHNGITKEEAHHLVMDFVHQAKHRLDVEHRFELHDIGTFRYTTERKLEFEYVEADNLLEESFGLPELTVRPVRPDQSAVLRTLLQDRQPAPTNIRLPFRKKLRRYYNVAAGLALCGLTASALYFLSLQTEYNLSSLNPIASMVGNYALPAGSPVLRYASDYVPLTQEEQQTVYAAILPVKAEEAEEENTTILQPALADSLVVSSEFAASTDAVEEPVNEQISEVVAAKETTPRVAEAKQPDSIIKNKTGRYYIITGGYSRLENAEVGRSEFTKTGQEAKVLLPGPGSKLFRVSVADFEDPTAAQAALNTYRKKYGESLWVLNY